MIMRFRALLALCAFALFVVSTAPSASAAPVYKIGFRVNDAYLSQNGRTMYWDVATNLRLVSGKGTPGTCQMAMLRVTAFPLSHFRPMMGSQSYRVTACYRRPRWSYTGYRDLIYLQLTPGKADMYFRLAGVVQKRVALAREGVR